MERKRPLCGCGRDGKCHDDDDDGGANVLPCNRATCTNCSQDQSGSCCPRGPLAQLQFDGLPESHTNVWKGEKTSESWKNQASFQSDLPFFFVLNLSQATSLAFFSPAPLYASVAPTWLEFFLVEVEAVEGSHQGANYSLKGCLVSSIFYWRYGVQGARLPIPYHHSSAPSVPPFIRLVSQGSGSPKSRSGSGPEWQVSQEPAHAFLLAMQWCDARGGCVFHAKQFVQFCFFYLSTTGYCQHFFLHFTVYYLNFFFFHSDEWLCSWETASVSNFGVATVFGGFSRTRTKMVLFASSVVSRFKLNYWKMTWRPFQR